MSWWISLEEAETGNDLEVDIHSEGGTRVVGGTEEATLNVTYNYGGHFRFPELHEKAGAETVAGLEAAVEKLGTQRSDDYWEPTPGNAGHACAVLLGWAKQHPSGVWRVN